MTRALRLTLGLALALTLAMAQTEPQARTAKTQRDETYRIRSYTRLVQVPVVVVDGNGKAVHDLTKDDFELFEEGKPVIISTFQSAFRNKIERNVPGRAPTQEQVSGAPRFSNVPNGKPAEEPILILAIDAISTDFFNKAQTRREMMKFLADKVEPGTRMSLVLFTRHGLRVLLEYSQNPQVVMAALKRALIAEGQQPGESGAASSTTNQTGEVPTWESGKVLSGVVDFLNPIQFKDLAETADTNSALRCLRALAQVYAGVPGRKSLFWVSGGYPYYTSDTTSIDSTDIGGAYLNTFDRLNQANIAVYPIDARGLLGYAPAEITKEMIRHPWKVEATWHGSNQQLGGQGDTDLGRVHESRPEDSMKQIAELTGGVAYYGSNDLSGAMKRGSADAGDYYMLGYYLQDRPNKSDRRRLKVEVKRPGLRVRSRQVVFVGQQALSPREEVAAALSSPLQFTNLPIVVTFDPKQPGSAFEIAMAGSDLELEGTEAFLSLNVVVEARAGDGKVLDRIDQTLSGKIKEKQDFQGRPFIYRGGLKETIQSGNVRFIVRDNNSGKMGSVIVEVP